MVHRVGLLPAEIDRLTPSELALCLDAPDDKPTPPHGGQDLGGLGVIEYAKRWRAMSLKERLARAREG